MTNVYSKDNSIERYNLICNLKALGRQYKFEKYTTAQLYRIYQKELQKASKCAQNESIYNVEITDEEYIEAMQQLEKEKANPLYKITSTGECYIKNDSGSYEYIIDDDLREEAKQKVYHL